MPIDPSIPLSVRMPQVNDPAQSLAQVYALQGAQQEQQIRQLQMQEYQRRQEDAARKLAVEQEIGHSWGPLTDGLTREDALKGLTDDARFAVIPYLDEYDKRKADLSKSHTELTAHKYALWKALAQGVQAAPRTDDGHYNPEGLRRAVSMAKDAATTDAEKKEIDNLWGMMAGNFGQSDALVDSLASYGADDEKVVPAGATLTRGGKPIYTAPFKATNDVDTGSFEDYVIRWARENNIPTSQVTTQQIAKLREDYRLDQRQPINIHMPGGVLTPNAEAELTRQLAGDWRKFYAPIAALDRQVSLMDTGMAAARRGDLAQGAQQVLVTFQKILDPPSVVRESEYARSAVGLSVVERAKGQLEAWMQGGAGVPLSELEKFARLARESADGQRNVMNTHGEHKRIEAVADRYKIPKELVFAGQSEPGATDSEGTVRAPAPKTPSAAPGGPNIPRARSFYYGK
jgi:hypothetical protein